MLRSCHCSRGDAEGRLVSTTLDTVRRLRRSGVDVKTIALRLHLTVADKSAIPQIRQRLESQGIQVRRIEPIPPSMEDVFVAMIEAEDRKAA